MTVFMRPAFEDSQDNETFSLLPLMTTLDRTDHETCHQSD